MNDFLYGSLISRFMLYLYQLIRFSYAHMTMVQNGHSTSACGKCEENDRKCMVLVAAFLEFSLKHILLALVID